MALDFPNTPVDGQVYDNFIYNSVKGTWKSLSSGASPSLLVNPTITDAVITATANTSSTIPLIVNGAASQSANLQEWKNSSEIVLADIDNVGNLQVPKIGVGGSVPPTSPSSTTLQLTGRAKILSNGAESAGIWLTGSNNIDSAFIGQFSPVTTDHIGIYHNGAWRLSVSNVGIVTMPNQPTFYAQGSGTQVLSGTQSNVIIPMVTATENVGNHFNTSNYRFTAPVAGKYFFWAQAVTTDATSTGPEISILKNGAVLNNLAISYNSAFYNTFGAPMITTLAANDYIQMSVTNNNNTTFTIERGRSRFAGYLIG
jgi:hypothetical protein